MMIKSLFVSMMIQMAICMHDDPRSEQPESGLTFMHWNAMISPQIRQKLIEHLQSMDDKSRMAALQKHVFDPMKAGKGPEIEELLAIPSAQGGGQERGADGGGKGGGGKGGEGKGGEGGKGKGGKGGEGNTGQGSARQENGDNAFSLRYATLPELERSLSLLQPREARKGGGKGGGAAAAAPQLNAGNDVATSHDARDHQRAMIAQLNEMMQKSRAQDDTQSPQKSVEQVLARLQSMGLVRESDAAALQKIVIDSMKAGKTPEIGEFLRQMSAKPSAHGELGGCGKGGGQERGADGGVDGGGEGGGEGGGGEGGEGRKGKGKGKGEKGGVSEGPNSGASTATLKLVFAITCIAAIIIM